MANIETGDLGGEGVAVYLEGLISWVFTPVLRECGVMVKGGFHYFLVTRAHFCRAVIMWGESIRESEFPIYWLVYKVFTRQQYLCV